MNENLDSKSRKKLEDKLLTVLSETIQPLSKEYQLLLADDLVTAFESRFKALVHAQNSLEICVDSPARIEQIL